MIIHTCNRYRFMNAWTNKHMCSCVRVCCYAPDVSAGPFSAVIRRCREIFNRWECGFHWKLWCHWLKGLRRRRVVVIMQVPGIRAQLFIYTYYHMRCYRQYVDLYLYFCVGVMLSCAADDIGECFSSSFSFKKCILINILLRFYWDYTGRSALGQVKTLHRKATRHHLKQCRITDAYMRHRESVVKLW